jgi:putative transposase
MDGSIRLSETDRKRLLEVYRGNGAAREARRAHVLLLLADGYSYREIMALTYCSAELVSTVTRAFRERGIDGVRASQSDEPASRPLWWGQVTSWLSRLTPRDFGYFRTRWSCGLLAEVLAWETGRRVSAETIRRVLHRHEFVWRRPRPVVGPKDPEFVQKHARIQALLRSLPNDETAVFQAEVDVHLNPKIGSMWMRRGQQAEVVTPGNNDKRHLAGSLVWRTGTLILSAPGTSRNAALFVRHLDDLRRRLRRYRKIHVICDNAKFHDCGAVWRYLRKWGHRIVLHFLPKYAPETNPIEKIWWRLHDELTRNHRCQTIHELLDDITGWVAAHKSFNTEALQYYTEAA